MNWPKFLWAPLTLSSLKICKTVHKDHPADRQSTLTKRFNINQLVIITGKLHWPSGEGHYEAQYTRIARHSLPPRSGFIAFACRHPPTIGSGVDMPADASGPRAAGAGAHAIH